MFRFLRFCAFLFVLFFTSNLMAAGYTCDTVETYTSCVEGYYLEACGTDSSAWTGTMATPVVGKTCLKCPDGYKCLGGQACPVREGIHCAAGEYIMAGTTTCAKCPAGKVCDAPTDTTDEVATSTDRGITGACPANSYCPEGSTSPTACPTDYGNSAAGSDSKSDCYTTCAKGTAVFSPGNACASGDSAIGMSWYSSQAHNVYYGKISSVVYCPYGSDMRGIAPSFHDSAADCLVTVPGGYSSEVARPDAQYIRISSEQGAFLLAEIEVMSDGVAYPLTPNSAMVNPGSAIDGNLGSSALVSTTSAQGYMAMFRTSEVVPIYNINFALAGNITRKIVIEISADATTWTTVFKGLVSSTSAAPSVLQHVSVMVRTNTQCAAGTYHAETSVFVGTNVTCAACPTTDGNLMATYENLTDAAYMYPDENLKLSSAKLLTWDSLKGAKSIGTCAALYSYSNSRGAFIVENVKYNTATGKYDKGGSLYYLFPKAGYYLTTKYSENYCNTGTNMFYKDAQVCPAGSYCEGRSAVTLCSSGTYADTLGIDGLVSVGYYSAGGATTSTPKDGTGCVGGNGCGPLGAGYFSVQPGMKKKSPTYMGEDCGLATIDGVEKSMGCGFVEAGYYSTGGGTHPRPTASGNGCIAGENCGKVAPGYYSIGGAQSSTGEGTVAAGYFSTGGAKTATPYSNEDCVAGETCGELEAGYFSTGGAIKSNPTSADCVGYIGSDIWGSTDVPSKNVCGSILPGYYSTGGGVLPAPGNLDVTNSTALGFNVDLLNQDTDTVRTGCSSQQRCGTIAAGYWSGGGAKTATPRSSSDCVGGNCGLIHIGFYSTGGGKTPRPYPSAEKPCADGFECGYVAAGYYSNGGGTSAKPTALGNGCIGQWNNNGTMTNHICGKVDAGYFSTGGAITPTPTDKDCHGYDEADENDIDANRCGMIDAGYYGAKGAVTSTGSGKVDAGYWNNGCGINPKGEIASSCSSSKSGGIIEAGYWGEAGATTSKGSGMVLAGFYSNGGGTLENPYEAGNGCLDGQECGAIDAGYWNTGGGTSATPTTAGDGCVVEGTNGCGKVSAGYWNNGCGTNPDGRISDACGSEYAGGMISPGHWGEAGATTPAGSGVVDAGFYSTGGGTAARPTSPGNGCLKDKGCGQLLPGYWNDGCGINPKGGIDSSCVSSNRGGIIDAGYWGGYGATTSKGSGKVSAGYWNNGCGINPEGGIQSSCSQQNQGGTIWPGYWGEAGATTPEGSGKVNAGYYNMGGGTSPTPVMRGNGCVNDSTTQCGTVAPGYWGEAGATQYSGSGKVSAGYYSTGGGTSKTPSVSDCVGKVAIIDSATGKLTGASDTDNTCGLVGAGYWNNGAGINAQGGVSSGYEGGQVAAGYFSTGGATTAEPISEMYCVGADTECGTIAAGHWGEAGATIPTGKGLVYAGYWNNGCGTDPEGGIHSSCSQNQGGRIAAGYWGEAGATTPKGRGMVYAGYYSTGGATMPMGNGPVKAGYYNMGGGTSPTPVMRGSGCVDDSTTQCGTVEPGYWGEDGATSSKGSGKVSAGYWNNGCGTNPEGGIHSSCSQNQGGTIAAGHWGEAGATTGSGSGTVFPGYFSTGGAIAQKPSNTDCVGDNECGLVDAGYWTSWGGRTKTPANAETDCVNKACGVLEAGYYSTGGATRQNPTEIGNHCFGTECGRVEAGYYSNGGGTSAKGTCLNGNKCGVLNSGVYSTCGAKNIGDSSTDGFIQCLSGCECGLVGAGFYSTGGGTSANGTCLEGYECGPMAAGYYSRGGAGNSTASGFYCWGYNSYSDGRNGCGKVSAGYWNNGGGTDYNGTCIDGKQCGEIEAGYWGAAGATSSTGSGQVDGGYFATGGATVAKPTASDCVGSGNTCGLINAGYWSVSGAKTATPTAKSDCIGMGGDYDYCGVISSGYYSTCGATYKYPATQDVDCVAGCECGAVQSGYYNDGCGIDEIGSVCSGDYKGGVVPAGYYTTDGSSMSPVAAGYYSTGGGTSPNGTCISGYECGAIAGGFYATGGGTTANGTCIDGKSCGLIEAGYYSTGGAKKAAPYLSNSCVGKKSDGTANTCGIVDGGYYSTGGGTTKTPTANGNGCTGSGKTCGKLAVAYYSNGGGTSATGTCIEGQTCGVCDSNYRGGTQTGKTNVSQCQASCAAGTRVATVNAACTSPAGGWFTGAHLVNWGNISPVNYCMDGYTSTSTSASGHDAKSDCVQTVQGKMVGATTIAARYIKVTSSGSAKNSDTHMLEIQAFASADGTGTNLLSGKGGTTGSKLTAATDGSWTRGTTGETYAQGSTLIWDLGSVQNLGSIKFAMYTDGRVYQNMAISVSTDNQDYTTVFQDADFQTQNTENPTGELVVLSAAPKACATGTYKASTTVALGNTVACNLADSGYFVGATGASNQTKCVMGSYTDTTGQSACKACAGGKTNSADGATSCTATCSNATGVASTGWETPVWGTDNKMTNLCTIKATAGCSAKYYKNSNACLMCPDGYQDGGAGYTQISQCTMNVADGKYVAVAKESSASGTCKQGYAKEAHPVTYGATSSCDACTGATYAAQEGMRKCEPCPTATNNTSDVVSYDYWNTNGKAGDQTTRAGCNVTFKSKTLDDGTMTSYSCYVDSGADTYGVNGTSKTCWVNRANLKCNGGYYNTAFNSSSTASQYTVNKKLTDLYANACVDAGIGYWSGADSLTRTACATGLVTCGAGLCANEAGDCGRKLHAGNNVIYLRSEKRTGVSPLLHLKVGEKMFYGNMSTSLSSPLKVKYNNTKYSVVNDNQ